MSRKPSPDGVKQVRDLLNKQKKTLNIQQLRSDVKLLSQLEAEAYGNQREILSMIECMDVGIHGNFGWESRMMWFLLELNKETPE